MKNFPHQFNNLGKLTAALKVIKEIITTEQNLEDDGVFGEALALSGVYTFNSLDSSIPEKIAEEKTKPVANQGFRTAAREIRRFFIIADLIEKNSGTFSLTDCGSEILLSANNTEVRNALWRDAMLQVQLVDSDGNTSHPYRILLKLVTDIPGIETSKLLLALESLDDSPEEYQRILTLADSSINDIISSIGVSEANARNAVKILPAIAEQVGDIVRSGGRSSPCAQPIVSTEDSLLEEPCIILAQETSAHPKPIDAESISPLPNFSDSSENTVDLSAAIKVRHKRTIIHHNAVQSIAVLLQSMGYVIHENPYDCLAYHSEKGSVLIEVKSLDGSRPDERRQSEKALGQLKSYRYYNVPNSFQAPKFIEVAAFSEKPDKKTIDFLQANTIVSVWLCNGEWFTFNQEENAVNFSPDELLSDSD